ncbi:unnamed protein product, partial [marine sediment metagenome]
GRLSAGHGRVLAALPSAWQRELAQKCLSRNWSVRKLEQEAAGIHNAKTAEKNLDPNLRALETALAEHIGSKVAINFSEQKGKVQIDFQNLDILQGILEKMGFDSEEVV